VYCTTFGLAGAEWKRQNRAANWFEQEVRLKYSSTLFALAALLASPSVAFADTITSGPADTTINYFGSPDTTSYGETFTAPGGNLQSWTFSVADPTGNFDFVIANWNGSRPVGPALYSASSSSATTASPDPVGATSFTWSGINLGLTTGTQYLAYITVAGVSNPTGQTGVSGTAADNFLGGQFFFLNSDGVDPLSLSSGWSNFGVPDMAFSANFDPVAVPGPIVGAGIPGLVMALGGLVILSRRRRNQAVLA
jgi:hypothetical protein